MRVGLFLLAVVIVAASTRLDICHRQGDGRYRLIEISAAAESAHRAHGDARPGEVIPALGWPYRFGPNCEIDP